MRRDPTEFRKRFARWKEGKDVYQAGKVLLYKDGKEDEEYTVYDIPYIPEKAIKLTNAGLAIGARLSTNLLDSLANNAVKAGLPIRTAIGLATKESTLGNPTDDRSMRTLLNPAKREDLKRYLEELGIPYEQLFGQHINSGNVVNERELINYHKPGEIESGGTSVLQRAFELYKNTPHRYNPGQNNYQQLVEKRANEVMRSPEILKWQGERIRQLRERFFNGEGRRHYVRPLEYEDGKATKMNNNIMLLSTPTFN